MEKIAVGIKSIRGPALAAIALALALLMACALAGGPANAQDPNDEYDIPTPTPTASPTPTPSPNPTPTPFQNPQPPAPAQPPPGPKLMSPFPKVRTAGSYTRTTTTFTRVTVSAPRGARITARCSRGRCRRATRTATSSRAMRLRNLQRSYPPRTTITIRITSPTAIGKFVEIRTLRAKPPRRRDRCLRPGSTTPVTCQAA